MGPVLLAFVLAVLAWLLVVGDLVRRHRPAWHWYLVGYPATACRLLATWRKVAMLNDLAVSRRPPRGLLGDLVVKETHCGRWLLESPSRVPPAWA